MTILDHHGRGTIADPAELVISSVQPDRDHALLTVTGPLNVGATAELAQRVEGLLVAGARYLVVDLSQAHGVRPGVLRLLTTTSQRLMASRGWLKLSGAGPTLLAELDEASLSDLFTLYQAATGQGGHDDTRSAYPAPHQVA